MTNKSLKKNSYELTLKTPLSKFGIEPFLNFLKIKSLMTSVIMDTLNQIHIHIKIT